MSWISLRDLKVDHPIELAEYCQNNNIMDEAAIAWWAPHVIKKKKNIIGKVKSRSRKKNPLQFHEMLRKHWKSIG